MAAPAYSYRLTARQQPARRSYERPSVPRVKTVQGDRPRQATKVLPSSANLLAVVIAVVLVVVASLAFVRIYLSSEAIVTSIESEEISSSIATARSEGSALEVQASIVANDSSLKDKASELGMSDPANETYITLPQDVVATNKDGSLSLTESIQIASGSTAEE